MRARLLFPLAAAAMLGGPAAASAAFPHIVARGESLYSVAAVDRLSERQLAAANGLSPSAHLIAGATLMIPPRSVRSHPPSGTVSRPTSAARTIAASVSHRDAHDGATRHSGHVHGVPVTAARADTGGKLRLGWSRGRGLRQQRSYPMPRSVTLPPSFAEGVAGQVTGSNNSLVSSNNARDVIQVVPLTWNWVGNTFSVPTPGSAPRPPTPTPPSLSKSLSSILPLISKGLSSIPSSSPSLTKGLSSMLPSTSSSSKGLSSVRQTGPYPSPQQPINDLIALLRRFDGG